jgi:hypothetical protein
MRRARRGAVAAWVMCLVAGIPARASATPNFPTFIQQYWDLSYTPPCTLCHTSPTGGLGTVNTPFGVFMRSRGLSAYDLSSLQNALDADRYEREDSDGDGVPDYQELLDGTDPNVNGAGTAGPAPQYGFSCAASPGLPASGRASIWLFLTCVVAVWWRSRRRHPS